MRRRDPKLNKTMAKAVLILFLASVPAIVVHVALYNMKASPTVDSIGTVVVFILSLIAILGFLFFRYFFKGRYGEWRVNMILKRMAKKYSGKLIYDVIIPGDDGKTSQIDHILVCSRGLFVVETKNYAGRIYGNESQREWTQVLNYGRVKNKFYNPLMQNYTHMRRLKELLPEWAEPAGAVVFVRGNVGYVEAKGVYSLHGLKRLIMEYPCFLEADRVNALAETIQRYKDNPVATAKEHVRSIKENGEKLRAGICPRCGAPLVLRYPKSGGSPFYGCSNYPKCKFHTKTLDN